MEESVANIAIERQAAYITVEEASRDREEGEVIKEPAPEACPSRMFSFDDIVPRLKPEHTGLDEAA